ncbi:MAG: hypothetical protein AAFV80_07585, partial [Bacteroidota bacterium]
GYHNDDNASFKRTLLAFRRFGAPVRLIDETFPSELKIGEIKKSVELNSGGFIFVGRFDQFGPNGKDAILRTNELGDLLSYTTIDDAAISISGEVINSGGAFILIGGEKGTNAYVSRRSNMGNLNSIDLNGAVYSYANTLCSAPAGDTISWANWQIQFSKGSTTYLTTSDTLGNYALQVDTGFYQVEVIPPRPYWALCDPNLQIGTLSTGTSVEQDLLITKTLDCQELTVDMNAPFLRRCFPNFYTVDVCNSGTLEQTAPVVEVVLDPFFNFQAANPAPSQILGDTLIFLLESMDIGTCVEIDIVAELSCDAELGQAHCSTVTGLPSEACLFPGPTWDDTIIEVAAQCLNDSLRFILSNTGAAGMSEPRDYLIIQNDQLFDQGTFQLASGENLELSVPKDGSTWRLEAQQAPDYSNSTIVSKTVEGCADGSFSTGYLTMFPVDDPFEYMHTDCQENIGAYDPNDKLASPKGWGAEQFIETNTPITYRVRFQNTGTDTAFNVVVVDPISPNLDINSLRMGASSHDYTYSIEDGRLLKVRFDNIMLPDSNVNEPLSNGFFTFRIKQMPDLPLGTIIENSAGIYFDFNPPIITNTYQHEVGEFLVETGSIEPPLNIDDDEVVAIPNPFTEQTRIQLPAGGSMDRFEFRLFDPMGRLIVQQDFMGTVFDFQTNGLIKGLYYFEVRSDEERLYKGKLVVH